MAEDSMAGYGSEEGGSPRNLFWPGPHMRLAQPMRVHAHVHVHAHAHAHIHVLAMPRSRSASSPSFTYINQLPEG